MPTLNNFFRLKSINGAIFSWNENILPKKRPIKTHKKAEEISKLLEDKALLI